MAPHLTAAELTEIRSWTQQRFQPEQIKCLYKRSEQHKVGDQPRKLCPEELWKKHKADRRQRAVKPICVSAFRKVLRGRSYNKSEETRGRKRKLSDRAALALDRKRKELVDKCKGTREVHWPEVIKKARVTKVHQSTAKKSLARAGIPVATRRNREKPERRQEHIDERMEKCGKWRYLADNYFSDTADLIMDNKGFDVPTTPEARAFKNKQRVRYQIRARAEGLLPQYTKPNCKRNKRNLGGRVTVCAGISKDRVVLWKYIEGKWNGKAAESVYRNDIAKIFQRRVPHKAAPVIVEDNDPTGYKSSLAVAAKRELGFKVFELPRYSPDLNPMDFFLWNNIEQRMALNAPTGRESVDQYKKRLRKVAMSTSRFLIRKTLATMKQRINAVYEARGNHIKID